jgi:hypothetical protein
VLNVFEVVVRELETAPSSTPVVGPQWGPCPPANRPLPEARGWSMGKKKRNVGEKQSVGEKQRRERV